MGLLRNLIKLNRSQFIRSFSSTVNHVETLSNYHKHRETLLINLMKGHKFDEKQQQNVCKFVIENQIQLSDQDLMRINDSINFWKKNVEEKPSLSKDGSLIDRIHILSMVEPSLLFIDCKEMKKRIDLVINSGFVDCKGDVARLFIKAPKAIFLQEWSDVIMKAYYIHNRVVDWILNKKPCALYPHPIVKYPVVMEMDYADIKTRFLFAIKSGYKSKGLFQELSKATPYDIFRDLLVIDFEIYLQTICKGLTLEEYQVYREMIRLQHQEEDEIFRNLSLLNNSISSDTVDVG